MAASRSSAPVWVLGAALVACTADDPPSEPRAPQSAAEDQDADEPKSFPVKGTLELRPLADNSEFAHSLTTRPVPAGVRVRLDHNVGPPDEPTTEAVLEADDRETLEDWAREFAAQVPADFKIAYEKTTPVRPVTLANPVHKGWRLHFVWAEPGFTVQGANARLSRSPHRTTPEIRVKLADGDAKRFEDLTRRIRGHKLAIVLDDDIISAPVVHERISGGVFVVTLAEGPEQARAIVAKIAGVPIAEVELPD